MDIFPATDEPVPEIDPAKPHPARIYDYGLGGKNHFAADRAVAEQVLANMPAALTVARENRKFLGRAVRYLVAEAGVRQFLDIGAGLPTTENVHEVAQRVDPTARIVYVDNDPLVLVHARALLRGTPEGRTGYIHADLRDPTAILADPVTREVLDFGAPIGLILVSVLPFLTDADKPAEVLATLLDALPSGSYLAATHTTAEHDPEGWAATGRAYAAARIQGQLRESGEFARMAFKGLELVPPGVVLVSEWRPDDDGPLPAPAEVSCYGGVARKPLPDPRKGGGAGSRRAPERPSARPENRRNCRPDQEIRRVFPHLSDLTHSPSHHRRASLVLYVTSSPAEGGGHGSDDR